MHTDGWSNGSIQDAKTFKTELSRIAKLNGLYEEIYTASH